MKKKTFYNAREIKQMVLQERKLPYTSNNKNLEVDSIVKSREPISNHKHIKMTIK